jgi:hypothetical protein
VNWNGQEPDWPDDVPDPGPIALEEVGFSAWWLVPIAIVLAVAFSFIGLAMWELMT